MSDRRYLSSAQQAAIAVYEALHDRPLAMKGYAELADTCGLTRDRVFRALRNWERWGFVEQGATARGWRLTPRAAALSERVRDALMAEHLSTGDADER